MTHRLRQRFLFVLFISGSFLFSAPLVAQDSPQPEAAKSSNAKSKKTAASSTAEGSARAEDNAAKTDESDKGQSAKTDEAKKEEAKKKEDASPAVESPKLIQVPQDETTYTPRPRVTAVFVFTNGNRIESDDYLITKDAVFINKDGQKTRYSISSIDRAATKAANEGRGVDIVFPKSKSEFNLDF